MARPTGSFDYELMIYRGNAPSRGKLFRVPASADDKEMHRALMRALEVARSSGCNVYDVQLRRRVSPGDPASERDWLQLADAFRAQLEALLPLLRERMAWLGI